MVRRKDGWCEGRPPRAGVFERELLQHPGRHFAKWDGASWYVLAATPELAERQTKRSLFNFEPFVWREVPLDERVAA